MTSPTNNTPIRQQRLVNVSYHESYEKYDIDFLSQFSRHKKNPNPNRADGAGLIYGASVWVLCISLRLYFYTGYRLQVFRLTVTI